MKNQRKRVCGHFFLMCAIVTIFGCGAESAAPSNEPLRGILGSGDGVDTGQGEAQEYTDDGVPIITTDQEEQERQRAQASHTANGELTCTGIFDCFNGCADDDQACVESCVNQGSEQARTQVDAIAMCMQNNQCADNACVESQCGLELAACGFGQENRNNEDDSDSSGESGTSDSSDSNQLDCNGIYACFGDCPEGDRECLDDCFGQGSSDAQSHVNAIGQCAQDNQCQDGACVESNCPSQVAACNGNERNGGNSGGDIPATGTLSCAEIFECYGQCARGDQGCLDACERAGTAPAQSQVNSIGSCIERNQCEDSGCVDRMCSNEVANCGDESSSGGSGGTQEPNVGGGGSGFGSGSGSAQGTQSCLDVFECFETCAEGDRGCLDNCYEQGTALAQLAVSNVGSCVQANQCQDDDCVARMCPQEVAACEGQSGSSSGGGTQPPAQDSNLACPDIYECFRDCAEQDQSCRQACFDRGSITSQGQVNAIGTCVQNNQCEDDECVETHCYDELVQCGFDVEPPEEDTTYIDPLTPPQDGDDPSDSSGLNNVPPGQASGMCGGAYPLTWGTQTGTTTGSASEHRGTCSGNGSEAVFEFTLDEDTMICLDTFDSSFDTAIYVRADECGSQGTEVACNDDTYGIQSQVHFSAQTGVTYYVFVDSYDLSGNFNLTATRGDCRDRFGF